MVEKDSPPAALEGNKIQLKGQKIEPNTSPTKIGDEIVFPVKASKRAEGEIIEERDPKTPKFRDYSMLNLGDKVLGKHLWGFSSSPIRRLQVGE